MGHCFLYYPVQDKKFGFPSILLVIEENNFSCSKQQLLRFKDMQYSSDFQCVKSG